VLEIHRGGGSTVVSPRGLLVNLAKDVAVRQLGVSLLDMQLRESQLRFISGYVGGREGLPVGPSLVRLNIGRQSGDDSLKPILVGALGMGLDNLIPWPCRGLVVQLRLGGRRGGTFSSE